MQRQVNSSRQAGPCQHLLVLPLVCRRPYGRRSCRVQGLVEDCPLVYYGEALAAAKPLLASNLQENRTAKGDVCNVHWHERGIFAILAPAASVRLLDEAF